jgi:outer membrane protein
MTPFQSVLFVLASVNSVGAETLPDAIALAYQTNPTLQAQRAQVRVADETYVQARTGYQPTASVQATVTTQDNNQISVVNGTQGVGAVQTSNASLILNQPLYTGGRVASQVDAAQAGVLAAREALRNTEQTVLQSVIEAYMNVRRDQEALAIGRENLQRLSRQLDEIRARAKVGEITRTDVAQTQERVSGARSQLSTAEANLGVSRAAYVQVVGQAPGDLAPPPALEPMLPKSVDDAILAAQDHNPQLRQAADLERESAARVAAAKAQTRPTFSLQGNLTYGGGSAGYGSPFARAGHDIGASIVATLPITTGGLTSSQIRQAMESNTVDRIGIETARRQAEFSAEQSWRQLQGLRESVAADQEQVDAATVAFEGSRQEAKLGLRSTIDVLIAEQDLFQAELNLANAQRDAYVASSALLAAMGVLSVDRLAPGAPLYDPAKHFARVSRTPAWTPWTPAVAGLDRVGAPAIPPPDAPIAHNH